MFFIGILIFLCVQYIRVFTYESPDFFYSVFYFSIISIATLFLLPFLNSLKDGKGVLFKALTILSLTSYSIYLLNFTLIKLLIIDEFSNIEINWLKYILFWVLSILISIINYKYFEMPIMKLRDKFKF